MTRYCEECGCDVQEIVQKAPGHLRKECADCGSDGPFMAEPPQRWGYHNEVGEFIPFGEALAGDTE